MSAGSQVLTCYHLAISSACDRLQSTHWACGIGEAIIVSRLTGGPYRAYARICRFFVFHSILGLLAILCLNQFVAAAAPPVGENAYCGKGDVPKFEDKDGPAQLPKACYYTALDGTPSPGKQIRVAADSDFSAAVDSAKCGDTLLLAAGASYEIKELPSKKCDDQHYITIRTDTPNSKLPPEGTRITPAWAGVASLPGRPAYAQPDGGPAKLMAALVNKVPSGAQIGDHYRFIGIEWVSEVNAHVGRLATVEGSNHVIFDRNWFHPANGEELNKGVGIIKGARVVAVINSYFSGFNCIARAGTCTDSSAVGGGNGDVTVATVKVYNNFLEAAGNNLFFGGVRSETNPTDIEIRRNHIFKPMIWKEGEPGYTPVSAGNPPIVKNHFELKSGIRVLFEANLLENCWGGFTQNGFSILLTPKNQGGSLCPKCAVTDVTLRYNWIRNVAGAIVVANAFTQGQGKATDGGRYSIHDLIVESMHDDSWKGQGTFALLGSNAEMLHDVAFDHITAFATGPIFYVGNRTGEKIPNFSVTNSLLMGGGRRFEFSSVGGGKANCAGPTQRLGAEAVLAACFVNYKFEKNIIIGEKGGWPKGTVVVSSPKAAGVRDYQNGVSKNPRLCHSNMAGCEKASPGVGAATDGKDIGADVDAVESALAGVE